MKTQRGDAAFSLFISLFNHLSFSIQLFLSIKKKKNHGHSVKLYQSGDQTRCSLEVLGRLSLAHLYPLISRTKCSFRTSIATETPSQKCSERRRDHLNHTREIPADPE